MKKELIWIGLILIVVSLACSLGGGSPEESIITVEISSPQPDDTVTVGQEVFVVASAVSQGGVDKVYLSINGQIIATEEPEGLPQTYITNFSWTPVAEGQVVMAVVATNGEGQTSEASSIYVNVAAALSDAGTVDVVSEGETPTETTAPADTPAPSETPPPPTPTFTLEPTDEPTVTPSPTTGLIIGTLVINPGVILLPTVETVWNQTSFPNNDTANVTVTCPAGTTVLSGGFSTNPGVYVYSHLMKNNGWQAFASNDTGSSQTLAVFAVCAKNIAGASVQQVLQQGSISGNSSGNMVAACPFGSTVVGGGYASNPDQTLWVYNSSKKNNGWQVYATNSNGSGQLLNAYAICLSSDAVTTSTQVADNVIISGGSTGGQTVQCDSGLRTAGGYAVQTGLEVYISSPKNLNWQANAENITGSNKTMNVYAICLTFN